MKIHSVTLSLVVLALSGAGPVQAHEGKTHVIGTVSAADAEHVVVKDRQGTTVSIKLTKETRYLAGETAAQAGEMKVGDRVVVDFTGEKDSLTATQIRIGAHAPKSGRDEDAGGHDGRTHHDEHQHGDHN